MGRRACQGFLSYVTPRRVPPCAALSRSSPCPVGAVPTLWGAQPPAIQLAQEDHTPRGDCTCWSRAPRADL